MMKIMKTPTPPFRRALSKSAAVVLMLVASTLTWSCAGSESTEIAEEVPAPPPSTPELSEYEAELSAFKTADFDYIYSLKRKDGGVMTSDDKQFVRNNSHFATNRFSLIDDDKVIFAGSNYKFPEEGLQRLKERFELEDYSRTEEQVEARKKRKLEKKKKKAEPTPPVKTKRPESSNEDS